MTEKIGIKAKCVKKIQIFSDFRNSKILFSLLK